MNKDELIKTIPDLVQKVEAIAERYTNTALIPFAFQPMVVACDGKCKEILDVHSCMEDDDSKPDNDSDFPNKYCVRACFRCHRYDPRKDYSTLIKEIPK